MKKIIFILFILFLSCNSKIKTDIEVSEKITQKPVNKENRYFDFDEVIHYRNENIDDLKDIYANQDKNEIGKLKMGVILDNVPSSIKDTIFINELGSIGFKKSIVSKSKFIGINDVFSTKNHKDCVYAACIYIYRDILIFKKKSKIVGIAKICFECGGSQIYGAKQNTDNFGQSGDYQKLETLLNEKK